MAFKGHRDLSNAEVDADVELLLVEEIQMQFRESLVSSLVIGSLLVACGNQNGQGQYNNSNGNAPATTPQTQPQSQPAAPQAQQPAAPQAQTQKVEPAKVLLGRAPISQLGMPQGKPQFVQLPADVKITSGQQAAQLFLTGNPIDVTRQAPGTNLTGNNTAMGLDAVPVSYPPPAAYPPPGAYPPPAYGYGSSGYSVDWNWVLGGLLILGGAALIYYHPIGNYSYDNYAYYPYGPTATPYGP